ncbi:hypothetical protein PG985_008176 [Apiospora marii]|uniref:uncharacterized protein n=1 Tax=Apiospora marii TaxID=335849 RepID=UPI00312F687A
MASITGDQMDVLDRLWDIFESVTIRWFMLTIRAGFKNIQAAKNHYDDIGKFKPSKIAITRRDLKTVIGLAGILSRVKVAIMIMEAALCQPRLVQPVEYRNPWCYPTPPPLDHQPTKYRYKILASQDQAAMTYGTTPAVLVAVSQYLRSLAPQLWRMFIGAQTFIFGKKADGLVYGAASPLLRAVKFLDAIRRDVARRPLDDDLSVLNMAGYEVALQSGPNTEHFALGYGALPPCLSDLPTLPSVPRALKALHAFDETLASRRQYLMENHVEPLRSSEDDIREAYLASGLVPSDLDSSLRRPA